MIRKRPDCRGWQEICEYLGVIDPKTAKKILLEMKLLVYEAGRPVLSTEAYRIRALERHNISSEEE